MGRPKLFPRQVVTQVSDDLKARIDRDADQRDDKSKSAATRRLLELGAMLDDTLSVDRTEQGNDDYEHARQFDALLIAAEGVL